MARPRVGQGVLPLIRPVQRGRPARARQGRAPYRRDLRAASRNRLAAAASRPDEWAGLVSRVDDGALRPGLGRPPRWTSSADDGSGLGLLGRSGLLFFLCLQFSSSDTLRARSVPEITTYFPPTGLSRLTSSQLRSHAGN